MPKVSQLTLLAAMTAASTAFGQLQGPSTSFAITRQVGGKWVSLEPIGENIVRVRVSATAEPFNPHSFAVLPTLPPGKAPGSITGMGLMLNNSNFSVQIENGGDLVFRDKQGKTILAEASAGRSFEPAEVQSEKTHHIRQQWLSDASEALFGLGQHQFGLVNIKGYDFDLWQHNTEIAVPFLVSSKGYGILWDNNSLTKFGDPRDFSPIPAEKILDATGNPGGFTRTAFSDAAMTTAGASRVEAALSAGAAAGRRGGGAQETAVRWEGQVAADTAGTYQFRLNYNGGAKMWIDDKPVADHWRQGWLAWDDIAKADFAANSKHKIKIEFVKDQGNTISLTWKAPDAQTNGNTSLWSQVAGGIDYYFIYGGTGAGAIDKVIAGYRTLTGQAPMMPQWAFGLWQCRQRYETQQASLDVIKGFRDRKIPFDNIVQDWMYWRQDDWGSHNFDPQRFPNPDQWVKDIHAQNAHVMISVWGKFYPTTDNYKALNDAGAMYPVYPQRDWVGRGFPYAFYDVFNPTGRELFWKQVNEKLFAKGFDAWWMDATEPDLVQPSPPTFEKLVAGMPKTGAGTGASVLNAYPLLNSQAVYEGQRKANPDQRVFILTRSGFIGQQRYATASWSGDISSSWTAMKKQIAAGLGYSISGLPYWTQDSGGFSVPARFNNPRDAAAVDEWREMNTRWFQFSAFTPLLRVHGEAPFREMWQFGGEESEAYKAMLKADQLRYRLLPYVYSLAGDVTQNGGTFMRPLVMDFPDDKTACDINDQYMFGPSIMVSPVTTYKARSRSVYLPFITSDFSQGAPRITFRNWYDFWTGKNLASPARSSGDIVQTFESGQTIDTPSPYDQLPLHIRAGSIIPFGPDLQYAAEKKSDPLTLYVYTGTDGKFTLYEDDGLTYACEKGAFSRIPITWNEQTQTLTLSKRQGAFPGM
ncbi:MAG TPA: TIM-barrel domain-containing protein, partial [Phycisphaerae bacterium]|nr:TIM-barrel domain-containing protein [Phycisphaerae bacterium]